MKQLFLPIFLLLSLASPGFSSMDPGAKRLSPDTVVMNDGIRLHGLIIKNDAQKVVLQERLEEVEIPKAHIRRIEDQGEAGVYFADLVTPGKLPPWRMIVQDLRTDDNITSFREIPATTIDVGPLRNIPYLSFRINKQVEMNVYGDPEDPVCLEFGVYEHGSSSLLLKKTLRAYLAGCLSSRAQIAALYSLSDTGGEKQVGNLSFKITSGSAPDAYGGWWFSVADPKRLAEERVSDATYRKLTLPFDEVNTKSGRLREDRSLSHNKYFSSAMASWNGIMPELRGFYRDAKGQFKLLTSSSAVVE